MKLVFLGTSNFAIPSLRKIIESKHELLAVVTQPDRKKGRRLITAPPPVKAELEGKVVIIHQPLDISSPNMVRILKGYKADLFVVVAFGQILKKEVLQIPKIFCVNLHASLLPKYRGAAPINWAVIRGEKKTGLTTIKMDEKMDRGDIILKSELDILDTDTSQTLARRLSTIGADLLMETIDLIETKKAEFRKQDEKEATYAYKLKKVDGLIDWSMRASDIHNRVRGLMPWPGAYTHYKRSLLKIWESGFNQKSLEKRYIGVILESNQDGIAVGTGQGELIIKSLQLEGGKRLQAGDFLRGHKLKIGEKFK